MMPNTPSSATARMTMDTKCNKSAEVNGDSRSLERVVRCPHVERKECVIKSPCGMLMAVMECIACGDQQVGAHHYACERYQAPNNQLSDGPAEPSK